MVPDVRHSVGNPFQFSSGPTTARIALVGEAWGLFLPRRIWDKIYPDPNCGCWLWGGSLAGGRKTTLGYGEVWWGAGKVKVHRLLYETFVGPIPEGMQLDHLCRVQPCCNPAHLEPVTPTENVRRGIAGQNRKHEVAQMAECRNGHAWIPENIGQGKRQRFCRICRREGQRHRRQIARQL